MTTMMTVRARDVMRPVDGCIRQNDAQDVLEIMDVFNIGFMPLVDHVGGDRVRGAVTRSALAQIVRRFGADARVIQVPPVLLPDIPADTPVAQIADAVGRGPACVVTDGGGRVAGIYEWGAAGPDQRRQGANLGD